MADAKEKIGRNQAQLGDNMKKIIFALVSLLTVCGPLYSQSVAVNTGVNWRALPFSSKVFYVQGYLEGYLDGLAAVAALDKPAGQAVLRGDKKTVPYGRIVARVDIFYRNPVNLPVCMSNAVLHEAKSLAGHPDPASFLKFHREWDPKLGCNN